MDVRLASTLTRSTGGALTEKPECERAPWMILIEDLRSEKMRRHLSKAIVELYKADVKQKLIRAKIVRNNLRLLLLLSGSGRDNSTIKFAWS